MKFLLDINALLAWGASGVTASPIFTLGPKWRAISDRFWTCAHTGARFYPCIDAGVRLQPRAQASEALTLLKKNTGGFITMAPSPRLPALGRQPRQKLRMLNLVQSGQRERHAAGNP